MHLSFSLDSEFGQLRVGVPEVRTLQHFNHASNCVLRIGLQRVLRLHVELVQECGAPLELLHLTCTDQVAAFLLLLLQDVTHLRGVRLHTVHTEVDL